MAYGEHKTIWLEFWPFKCIVLFYTIDEVIGYAYLPKTEVLALNDTLGFVRGTYTRANQANCHVLNDFSIIMLWPFPFAQ